MKVPDASQPGGLESSGHRGLALIRSFMDEVSFNDAGNEITMIKRRVSMPIEAEPVTSA